MLTGSETELFADEESKIAQVNSLKRSPITISSRYERLEDAARHIIHISYEKEEKLYEKDVFFEISGEQIPCPPNSDDFAVIATIFFAMKSGRDLVVQGQVSASLLANLEEFQEAWRMLAPEKYQVVSIIAASVTTTESSHDLESKPSVIAFSGGVDATFTLLRHSKKLAGFRTTKPLGGILIHGFDIPLQSEAAFAMAKSNAKIILDILELPLITVRTNWREICSDWETQYVSGLSACLNLFSEIARFGLFGSDEDYANFVLPWASNPVTNHLLSSDSFRIVTDGAGYTRTEKVDLIGRFPEVSKKLRVCWEGKNGDNCGHCEKCVRTALNFMATGASPPPSLIQSLDFRTMLKFRVKNPVQLYFIKDILVFAKKNNRSTVPVNKLDLLFKLSRIYLLIRTSARRLLKNI